MDIKTAVASAPALANPDYSKQFHLYVSERKGYASAVLTQQQQGVGKRAIAYYSTALDNVEKGMPPCYRSLATAAFAYQKASSITMGHPVTLYTTHALHALLTSQTFVITNSRRTGYDSILSAPELTIERCTTVNPADKMVTPLDGEPHECVNKSEKFLKARPHLKNYALHDAQRTFFVDGSCFRTTEGNRAGYEVIEATQNPLIFRVALSVPLPQPCSAQLAEVKALAAACKLYTAYAHGVCHVFGPIWVQRGFQGADGSVMTHGEAISDLLYAMTLPSELAIVKCKAHKTDCSFITKGNAFTDETTKKAAVGSTQMMALTHPEESPVRHPMEDNVAQIVEMQNTAGVAEISTWIKRGAKKEAGTGLWRSIAGLCVAPASFLPLLIKEAHSLDHTNREETICKIRREWWSPYLASMVDLALNRCEVCIKTNVQKNFTAPLGHIPPPRHLMMDYVDMGAENRREKK